MNTKRITVIIGNPSPCHFDSLDELKRHADAIKEKEREYVGRDPDVWRHLQDRITPRTGRGGKGRK